MIEIKRQKEKRTSKNQTELFKPRNDIRRPPMRSLRSSPNDLDKKVQSSFYLHLARVISNAVVIPSILTLCYLITCLFSAYFNIYLRRITALSMTKGRITTIIMQRKQNSCVGRRRKLGKDYNFQDELRVNVIRVYKTRCMYQLLQI